MHHLAVAASKMHDPADLNGRYCKHKDQAVGTSVVRQVLDGWAKSV